MTKLLTISSEEYLRFRTFLQGKTGISLNEGKHYLVSSRLSSLLKERNIESIEQLMWMLEEQQNAVLLQKIVDKMTTNETLWFRDNFPFPYIIQQIMPNLARKDAPCMARIWCAGCSTGQEPYSISMAVEEALMRGAISTSVKTDIVATDISTKALDQAGQGVYQLLEVERGLSEERQRLHFDKQGDGSLKIKPHIQARVHFAYLNLIQMPYNLGKFDIIFCRNVLIYFSSQQKEKVITAIAQCMKKGGYLFLGATESMPFLGEKFEMVRCNPGLAYRKL